MYIMRLFQCWETYVGQQIYKLIVLNFIVVIGVTFFVEYPRRQVLQVKILRTCLYSEKGICETFAGICHYFHFIIPICEQELKSYMHNNYKCKITAIFLISIFWAKLLNNSLSQQFYCECLKKKVMHWSQTMYIKFIFTKCCVT